MDTVCNESHRTIKSGDLLIWDETHHDYWGKLLIRFIRFMTMSEYGHVGIAIVRKNEVFVLEAIQPRVAITFLGSRTNFYVVSMNIKDLGYLEDIAQKFLRCRYSLLDCVRGFLGVQTSTDNRWQCAELCNEVYLELGIDLKPNRVTPSGIVRAALDYSFSNLWIYRPKGTT